MYWCSSVGELAWPRRGRGRTASRRRRARSSVSPASESPLTTRAEEERRDLEVEDRLLLAVDRLGHPLVGGGVAEVALRRTRAGSRSARRPPGRAARRCPRSSPRALLQLVDRPVVDGHADDRAVEQPAPLEPVERPERHHLGEVAGDPEHDEDVRRPVSAGLCACALCRLGCCSRHLRVSLPRSRP